MKFPLNGKFIAHDIPNQSKPNMTERFFTPISEKILKINDVQIFLFTFLIFSRRPINISLSMHSI